MSLLGTAKTPLVVWDEQFSLGCALYRMGAWSEAYRLFAELVQGRGRESAALYFNIALCHAKAEQWERAAGFLDQALSLLKKKPLADRKPENDVLLLLAQKEYNSDSYLHPMPDTVAACAPDHARTAIRRLLADCCAELGLWDRVHTLAEALKPRRYRNVESALKRAEE